MIFQQLMFMIVSPFIVIYIFCINNGLNKYTSMNYKKVNNLLSVTDML